MLALVSGSAGKYVTTYDGTGLFDLLFDEAGKTVKDGFIPVSVKVRQINEVSVNISFGYLPIAVFRSFAALGFIDPDALQEEGFE